MTTRESTSPPPETLLPSLDPHFDADGAIDQDYYCFACGYNLRTLHTEATCPECGQSVTQTVEQRRRVGRNLLHLGQFSIVSRLCYAALGIVLPFICFLFAIQGTPLGVDMWQDSRWETYVALLYGGLPLWVFVPLMMYAMLCMAAMLVKPLEVVQLLRVRFGIYSGVVLSLQYLVILYWLTGGGVVVVATFSLGGLFLVATIVHGMRMLLRRQRAAGPDAVRLMRRIFEVCSIAGAVIVVLLTALTKAQFLLVVLGGSAVILLLFAPAWTLLVYVLLLLRIRATGCEKKSNSFAWPLLGIGWLFAWAGSWAASIHFTIEAYAKLPSDPPPGCYIATAAARGHRQLVGSHPLPCGNGQVMLVNRQLRLCKVLELALFAIYPRIHRLLRAIYDTLGPPLANRLTHPLAADAAYLLIAPIAAVAYLLLCLIGCDVERAMGRVYPTKD